jgi:hypothetical protein
MVIGKNRVRSSPSSFTYATPPAPPTP